MYSLVKCSECGANITIVSGRWRGRADVVYGCPQNAFRGETVCKNNVRVFRNALEGKLLAGLQDQIMRPEAVEYVLDNFESAVLKALDELGGELEQMRRRKDELEREIANLTDAVAQGDFSPALRGALVTREREISEITAKLLESTPDSLRVKLRDIRSFVVSHMGDIRAIVNSDSAQTRAIFAKHIEKITLKPTGEYYIASGTWDFVGRGSIGGAGGRLEHSRPRVHFQFRITAGPARATRNVRSRSALVSSMMAVIEPRTESPSSKDSSNHELTREEKTDRSKFG